MDSIKNIINSAISVKQEMLLNEEFLQTIQHCVHTITKAFKSGNKVLFCGNGGSAADAQHLAAEFCGRFYIDRDALPAEALHCNTSYMTAVANDYGFEFIFSRMIKGIGKKGDILVGLSTSGNSVNIIRAFETAKEKEMITIGLTGSEGGNIKMLADYLLNIPSTDTPRIQECHILVGHIICQLVEENLFIKESGKP
ncbi:MAG: D-sedoheptulose 7-phosphate isomerase [Ferruginibacter sp.]|nr:D-sedoheptulose 7-phosphate isomerase [Ferruginibacter sp.]